MTMRYDNVKLNEGFKQVCVWPGTTLNPGQEQEFEEFFLDVTKARIQFLEVILTNPDIEDGKFVEGTGGRSDLFFAVHEDDLTGKFCTERLQMGVRWIEDVIGNEYGHLYPKRVLGYQSWKYEDDENDPVENLVLMQERDNF